MNHGFRLTWPESCEVCEDLPMAMDAVEIERLIKAHIPDAEVTIRDLAGDLYHLVEPRRLDKHSRELLWAFVD